MQAAGREDAAPCCPECLRKMAKSVRELDRLLPEGSLSKQRAQKNGNVCRETHRELVLFHSRASRNHRMVRPQIHGFVGPERLASVYHDPVTRPDLRQGLPDKCRAPFGVGHTCQEWVVSRACYLIPMPRAYAQGRERAAVKPLTGGMHPPLPPKHPYCDVFLPWGGQAVDPDQSFVCDRHRVACDAIPHRACRITIDGPEVPLRVDQRVAEGTVLRHPHH